MGEIPSPPGGEGRVRGEVNSTNHVQPKHPHPQPSPLKGEGEKHGIHYFSASYIGLHIMFMNTGSTTTVI